MIIIRYLSKEIICTTVAVTSIVIFIFICNQFVRYLGSVANGKYAADMLFRLVSLQIPILFSLLLPMGLFFGLLLVYSRLYAESEMIVLIASGMSRRQLFHYTLNIGSIFFVILSVLMFIINPIIANKNYNFINVAKVKTALQLVTPGRFQSSMGGDKVFYTEQWSDDREYMKNIFLVEPSSDRKKESLQNGWALYSAKKGYQETDPLTGDHFMVMEKGYRYEGYPGRSDFQVIQFDLCKIRLQIPSLLKRIKKMKEIKTIDLIQHLNICEYSAELQWRLSIPLSSLLLSLLSMPLSRVRPREGRFKHFFPAILVYIIYINLLFLARYWVEDHIIPAWIGLWWVHILLFFLWIGLWFRERSLYS